MGYLPDGTFVNDGTDALGMPDAGVVTPAAPAAAAPTDLSDPKVAASEKLKADFLKAMDVSYLEQAEMGLKKFAGQSDNDIARGLINNRTPDQILNAFSEIRPEWKGVMEQIKADPALAGSLHKVLVKDPTMLEGFTDMISESGNANPQDFANALKDSKTRKALTKAFDKIAEKDNLTFKDFRELYDNRNSQDKTIAKLQQMGINPTEMMDMSDMLAMLKSFLQDPAGFLKNLPDMLGMGENEKTAWTPILNGVGSYMGLILDPLSGEEKGYGDYMVDAIEKGEHLYASGEGKKYLEDITGETDKKIAKGAQVAGLEGDKSNIAAQLSATKAFDLARYGLVPSVTPEQEREVAAYDANQKQPAVRSAVPGMNAAFT